jgi:hypothetical protein
MRLMTKAIIKQAQKQYPIGGDLDQQKVVAKFFDPCGSWIWYVMNQDPEDPDYLWGIVKGDVVEIGSFSLSDLQEYKGPYSIGIERDRSFRPQPAHEIYAKLLKGKHV